MISVLAWLVLGLPLLGCVILSLWPGEPDRRITRVVGVGFPAVAFVLTAIIFVTLLGRDADDRLEIATLWNWVQTDGLSIDLALQIDPLSVLMMLVITGVGSLILLYSTEYMEHDRDYRRFFAEMGFFLFAMLLLVEAANFFFLIVGWGLVGLASYLLIGYYYDRPSAVAAAKKAFVVNVIGDIGMVIAAFILVRELGTLDYGEVFATAPEGLGADTGVATAVALLLFVGAAAKSAQIPLHTWLPDAMEGPTPVSALIHAATMVTAGVYMIVRCNVLYELAPVRGRRRRRRGRRDAADGGHDRPGPGGHQARARLEHRLPDRLHDHGRGPRRVRQLDVPPPDARLLQGAALPRRSASRSTRWPASRASTAWAACAATCA